MRIKSFFAESIEAAMAQASQELGPEAMLLNSRRTEGELRHLGSYEVVCAVAPGINPADPRLTPAPAPATTPARTPALNQDLNRALNRDLNRDLNREAPRPSLARAAGLTRAGGLTGGASSTP